MTPEEIEARFLDQINGDARRVVYCVPGCEDLVREYAEWRGQLDLVEIRGHPALTDPNRIYVVDELAAKAAVAAFHQRQGSSQ